VDAKKLTRHARLSACLASPRHATPRPKPGTAGGGGDARARV